MSSEEGNGKGSAPAAPNLVDQIVLTYDRAKGVLSIAGQVINNDTALDILLRAVRHYETLVRVEAATALRQAQIDAAENERIRRELAKGRN